VHDLDRVVIGNGNHAAGGGTRFAEDWPGNAQCR
jgi:hypothetical protein